eukprot:SAG31_NODE_821_length_11784_cov_62.658194_6_plen_495_part_00
MSPCRELIGRLLDELDARNDAPPTAASEHRRASADVPAVADKKTPATTAAEMNMEDRVAATSTMTSPKQLKRPTPPPLLPRPHALSPQARLLHHDGDSDRRAAKLPHQSLLQGSVGSGPAGSPSSTREPIRNPQQMRSHDLDEQAWQNFTDEDRRSVDTHALDWAGTLDRGSQGNADSTRIRTGRRQLLSSGVLLEQLPATERRELELLNQLSGTIELESSANISKRDHETRSSGGRWGHDTPRHQYDDDGLLVWGDGRNEEERSISQRTTKDTVGSKHTDEREPVTVSERTRRQIMADPALAARYARSRRRRERAAQSNLDPAQKLARKMQAQSYRTGGQDWHELFLRYDRDDSGAIDFAEFRSAVRRDVRLTPAEVSDRQLRGIFRAMDRDKSGVIKPTELFHFLARADPPEADESEIAEELVDVLSQLEHAHRPRRESGFEAAARIESGDQGRARAGAAQPPLQHRHNVHRRVVAIGNNAQARRPVNYVAR